MRTRSSRSSSGLLADGRMSRSSNGLFVDGHLEKLIGQIRQQIYASGYEDPVQQVFCDMVNATVAISTILFPCSNILREDDRRDVERIARALSENVETISRHIDRSIDEVDQAEETLRSWCTTAVSEDEISWKRLIK